MDQNQTVDNDLQKAIDDITNNTNIDPVFSDPVAAPSSIPEGDTGELSDPIGPFLTSEDTIATPAPNPSIPAPESPTPPADDIAVPTFPAPDTPTPNLPAEPSLPPAPMANQFSSAPTPPPVTSAPSESPTPTQAPISANVTPTKEPDIQQIKTAALRDLVPLIDQLDMSPSQRFNICRNIFEDLHDLNVLEQAYRAASDITDNAERAEALLYLVESIDKA